MQGEFDTGIIAMLDSLGTGGYSFQETKRFLEDWESIIQSLANSKVDIGERFDNTRTPKRVVVQDTIILSWKLGDVNLTEKPDLFFAFGTLLQKAMIRGLEKDIFFRGAISIGGFTREPTQNGESILGPAVSQASKWYEEANWAGIITSPKSGFYLDQFKTDNQKRLENIFLRYPIPLKNGEDRLTWCLNWPRKYKNRGSKKQLIQSLARLKNPAKQISSKDESKIRNTIDFFDWVTEEFSE